MGKMIALKIKVFEKKNEYSYQNNLVQIFVSPLKLKNTILPFLHEVTYKSKSISVFGKVTESVRSFNHTMNGYLDIQLLKKSAFESFLLSIQNILWGIK